MRLTVRACIILELRGADTYGLRSAHITAQCVRLSSLSFAVRMTCFTDVVCMRADMNGMGVIVNSEGTCSSGGKETRLFAPFDTKNDRFTKTGSGKMYGKLKKDAFLQAVLLMATST